MRRFVPPVLFVLALIASACSGDDDGSAAITSVPDQTTTSSTTTRPATVAPDIIPTDESLIDEAYVEGVLAGLADASAEAFDATRAAGVVDERAQAITDATSSGQEAIRGINSLSRLARERFAGYRDETSPVKYSVIDVLIGSQRCIVAEIAIDASGLFVNPPEDAPPGRTLAELLPASEEQRSTGLNPTAWVLNSTPVIRAGDSLPDCSTEP